MSLNNPFAWPLVAASLVLLILWWYAYRSPLRVHDQATERSLHQGDALTGAGLFLFVPWSLIGLYQYPLFVPFYLVLILSLLGFWDDRRDLSFKLRLVVQLLVAVGLLFYLGFNNQIWLLLFLMVALLWWLNLFNFMDGANGLAGLHALITVGFYGWLLLEKFSQVTVFHYLFLATLLVLLVYLFFNLILRKLFMGDSGSLPMALVVAVMALYSYIYGLLSLSQIAVIHAVFIVDATMTLLQRMVNSENLTQAHATHLYQRLIKQHWSHPSVALIYASVTLACCGLAWVMSWSEISDWLLFFAVYLLLLGIFMKTYRYGR
ncbi:hypothetical protein OS175_06430 [Marinicella sp. S1101]|uniref:hypothetical protein n=1 Tax=Marinicella marina TaxID=2996016 RepID=UPI0022608AE3|nr:hypothetical protein [Marinicella marina]MCX7553509.1 hypothetical protein [Marinicella marina]